MSLSLVIKTADTGKEKREEFAGDISNLTFDTIYDLLFRFIAWWR
jgi:hypothetical protein